MGITLTLQPHVLIVLGITVALLIFFYVCNVKIKKFAENPLDKPKGLVLLMMWVVEIIDGFVANIVSPKYVEKLGPYIGTIAIYILVSNLIGLTGLDNPTANYSVTLSLALITWIMMQYTDIKYQGVGGYVKAFFEPIAPFVIPNFFGTIAPLISMSLRLFGNLTVGYIIMTLLYTFTSFVSSLIPVVGQFDILGVFIAAPLRCYFDIFSGAIQMFVFIMLTMVFIGNRVPEEYK